MKKIFLQSIVLAAILFGSCSAQAASEGDTLKIEGRINPDLLLHIENLPNSIRKIEITSQGGDTLTAISIGQIIRERNYELTVKKYCLSACAQWLMPSTKSLIVEAGAVVAFHQTSTFIMEILIQSGAEDEVGGYSEVASEESSFYKDIGVPSILLTRPFELKEPICFVRSEDTGIGYAAVATSFGSFVFKNETYQKLTNQRISGRWAETPEQLVTSIKKNIPESVSMSIIPETLVGFEDPKKPPLQECTEEQRTGADYPEIINGDVRLN